jgi:hypothetical protein
MEKNKEAWDHARAAARELRESVASMLPPAVAEHGRAAQKEALLAVRSLIDCALEHIEKKTSPSPAGQ